MDRYLKRLQQVIASATHGMTADDLGQHPEGKWSACEVLEHLYLTYTGTVKGFNRCLQAGKPLAGIPTLKQRFAASAVTRFGYSPEGRQAPERTRPRGRPADRIVQDVTAQLETMDDLITKCEARYGKGVNLVDHPILGPLTAHQWRKFHWVHGRHHVKQIWRLKGAGG